MRVIGWFREATVEQIQDHLPDRLVDPEQDRQVSAGGCPGGHVGFFIAPVPGA